jgi:hypothetical protein
LVRALALLSLLLASCARIPARVPVGEVFPSVEGRRLSGERVFLPGDLAGRPALLIVAFAQRAQLDVDRWALGLLQLGTPLEVVLEVPTVSGLVPALISTRIDDGMRSGIPPEDWSSVVTVYDDAAAIERFTGTERDLSARVLLLDPGGRVLWFHDRGFSPRKALELDTLVRSTATSTAGR